MFAPEEPKTLVDPVELLAGTVKLGARNSTTASASLKCTPAHAANYSRQTIGNSFQLPSHAVCVETQLRLE